MKKENAKITQNDLDIKKWLESEQNQEDQCGKYDFCAKCDKSLENPCAMAFIAFNTKKKVAKPLVPFETKLKLAKDETKEKYASITSSLKEAGVAVRMCKKNVTLRYNKVLIGLITLTKNSLKLHIALDPELHQEITHLDYSDKKTYADVPYTVKLTSKKSIASSINLLNEVKKSL